MIYVLSSLDGTKSAECEEKRWLKAVEEARLKGWDPEGTRIDFFYQVDEIWDDSLDYTCNLLLMFEAHMMALGWNGSYTEKENQVISESDAYALYESLDETLVSIELLDLLKSGAVRILR